MPDGVLVVDKPSGPTSHDAVERVRRAYGTRRAGHTGTLDPLATGVLPVCLGKATRLARFLAAGEKEYRATVRLGYGTTTDDAHGEPLGPEVATELAAESIAGACRALEGPQIQVPPAFSAKRVGGRRLYEMARAGERVQAQPVAVTIHGLELLEVDGPLVLLRVRCSPGAYVRALARDLGVRLGVGGHLVALRRTRSGEFGLEGAVRWGEIDGEAGRVIAMAALLPALPTVTVGAEGRLAVRHGRDLGPELVEGEFCMAPRLRILDRDGRLIALGLRRDATSLGADLPPQPRIHPDLVLLD